MSDRSKRSDFWPFMRREYPDAVRALYGVIDEMALGFLLDGFTSPMVRRRRLARMVGLRPLSLAIHRWAGAVYITWGHNIPIHRIRALRTNKAPLNFYLHPQPPTPKWDERQQ